MRCPKHGVISQIFKGQHCPYCGRMLADGPEPAEVAHAQRVLDSVGPIGPIAKVPTVDRLEDIEANGFYRLKGGGYVIAENIGDPAFKHCRLPPVTVFDDAVRLGCQAMGDAQGRRWVRFSDPHDPAGWCPWMASAVIAADEDIRGAVQALPRPRRWRRILDRVRGWLW